MGEALPISDERTIPIIGPRLVAVEDDGAAFFSEAFRTVDELGRKFWGLETGHVNVPYPQTPTYKVRILRKTLRTVPELPKGLDTWAKRTNDITFTSSEKYEQHPIEFDEDVRAVVVDPPAVVLDAYRTPAIKEIVRAEALTKGDPVITIADRFEQLLQGPGYGAVDGRMRRMGERALEIFLFSTGKYTFSKKIASTTVIFYKNEALRLREIEATREARKPNTE